MNPSTNPNLAQAQAHLQQAGLAHWKAWYTFLSLRQEQLTLQLRIAAGEAPVPFEAQANDLAAQLAEVVGQIKALPYDQRTLFERVLERETQASRYRWEAEQQEHPRLEIPPDDAEVEYQVLNQLLARAKGDAQRNPPLLGEAPLDLDQWVEIDPQVALSLPPKALYQALAASPQRDRRRLFAVVSLIATMLLALAAMIWWFYRPTEPSTTPPPLNEPSADQASLLRHPLAAALIDGAYFPLQSAEAIAGVPHICLPETARAALAQATEVRLLSALQPVEWRYQLPNQPTSAQLQLGLCAGELVRAATLIDLQWQAPLPITATTAFSTQLIGVRDLLVVRADHDPAIAFGTARLEVIPTYRGDLRALNPQLLLPDGTLLPPSFTEIAETQIARYLLPDWDTPQTVFWQVTDPVSGRLVRWALPLPVQPTRAEQLARDLRLDQITARVTADQLLVTIQLFNRSTAPLILSAADLAVAQAELPLSLSEAQLLPVTIEPAAEGVMQLTLPNRLPTELQFADAIFIIE